MGLTITTPPAVEPVTRNELKAHLRLDTADDDLGVVQSLVPDARGVGTYNGTAVEVSGYQATVFLDSGTFAASASLSAKLQESNDGQSWTDVTGGAFTTVNTNNDNAVQELAYTGGYTYIRAVATVAEATADFAVYVSRQALTTDENDLLDALIVSARQYAELFTGRAFITTTFKLTLDEFATEIRLPRPPTIAISTVKYYDTDGVQQTLSSSYYTLDNQSEPARLVEAYTYSWPSTRDIVNAVEVNYTAGYGAAASAVPDSVKQAIMMLAAYWYENRETVNVGNIVNSMPLAVDSLLWMYRVVENV